MIANVLAAINFHRYAGVISHRTHMCIRDRIGTATLAFLLFLSLLPLLKIAEDYSHGAPLFFPLVAITLTIAVVRATQHKLCASNATAKIEAGRAILIGRKAVTVE
jgi:uncharacterized membrane protein